MISGTPQAANVGESFQVQVTATDFDGSSLTATFNVQVTISSIPAPASTTIFTPTQPSNGLEQGYPDIVVGNKVGDYDVVYGVTTIEVNNSGTPVQFNGSVPVGEFSPQGTLIANAPGASYIVSNDDGNFVGLTGVLYRQVPPI